MRKIVIVFFLISQVANATSYFVAPSGNDRNTGIESPFRTIQRGINSLNAGDTLFVRSGVYSERIVITGKSATSDNPIVITAFAGEKPIIDGAGVDLGGEGNGLVVIYSPYIKLNGFEIRNVDMTGRYKDNMAVYLGGNDVLSNCVIHNAFHGGVQVCGNNNIVEYCTVYDCSMYNSDKRIKDGNSAGISIRGIPSAYTYADRNILRHSIIHDVWGETVSAVYTQHTIMEDNTVYQGGIYICNSQHGLYQRNLVYISEDMGEFKHTGIGCADEYPGNTNSDNTIINNICYGAWSNFFTNSLINCVIANNTFVNSRYDWGVVIYKGFTHSNSYFVNNIIIQEGSAPCIFYDGSAGITFGNNLWNKPASNNLEGGYAKGTGDVISATSISRTGSYTLPDYYKLYQGSPAIDAGRNMISSDFAGNTRIIPDIGAFEYSSGTTEPVSPAFVSSSVENATPSRVDITFSLSLAGIVPATSAFTVTVNSAPRQVTSVTVSGTSVRLTLSSAVVYGDVVTVAYTKPSSSPLQTTAGSQAASFSAQAVTNKVNAPPQPAVPSYVSSSVENATPSRVDITFSLSLAGIVPATSAFAVTVNSAPRQVSSVTVTGTSVRLNLSSGVVYGDVVTVAYTKPSSSPLQTTAGGQAASFSALNVINKIAAINNNPVVIVNSPEMGYSGFVHELNATGSYDVDKDNLSFLWTSPSIVPISSTTGPVVRFLGPVVSTPTPVEFTLKVSDGKTTVTKKIPVDILPYMPELETADIVNVEASSYYLQDYPFNIADGNIGTDWSAKGIGEWLIIEIKESFNIQHIELAFHLGQMNQSCFDILASTDKVSWEPILTKTTSCGFSGDPQVFDFPPYKADKKFKYLKIIGLGNTSDEWNYISEMKVIGYRYHNPSTYENLPVKIFPNPAGEKVTVRIENVTFVPDFVRISDLTGSVLLIQKVDPDIREFDLSLDLSNGLYILHMGSGSVTTFAQKLIIRKK